VKNFLIIAFLCVGASMQASEKYSEREKELIASKKERIKLYKTHLKVGLFGLGTSFAAIGAYLHAVTHKSKNNKSVPACIRYCRREGLPFVGLAGIYYSLQYIAIAHECLDTAQLGLLKIEDPEKYKKTPIFYTDAPLYDGGRRVNEDGSYCDDRRDEHNGWWITKEN
jgi:hypothetical protein